MSWGVTKKCVEAISLVGSWHCTTQADQSVKKGKSGEKVLMTQSLFLRLKAAVIQHFMLDSAEGERCAPPQPILTKKLGLKFSPL